MANFPLGFSHSIERSNLRDHEKSAWRKWWDDFKLSSPDHHALAEHHLSGMRLYGHKALHVVRTGGESVAFGSALALAHSNLKNGLDIPLMGFNVPADALLGAMSSLGAIAAASDPNGIGVELQTGANSAWTVLGFRKTMDIMAEIKAKTGGMNTGTVGQVRTPSQTTSAAKVSGEDPIVALAEKYLKDGGKK